MRKSRFTEAQIIGLIKAHKEGLPIADVTAEAETRLFFDMGQCHHVRPLSAAGGAAEESA